MQPDPSADGTQRTLPQAALRALLQCQLAVDTEVLLELVRGHWGVENGLHRTLDVQFREDNCRLHTGHGPAVVRTLPRAALNMVRTAQQYCSTDVSISLLRDRIERHPLDSGCRPALIETLRLPCMQPGSCSQTGSVAATSSGA